MAGWGEKSNRNSRKGRTYDVRPFLLFLVVLTAEQASGFQLNCKH